MRKLKSPILLDSLAVHLASGGSVADWAAEHGIALRTAFDWAALPETKESIRIIQRRLLDQAIGQMHANVRKANVEIDRLIDGASSESVRLSAARGVLGDLIQAVNFVDFDRRLTALEKQRG